jgi:hypothetical protein
MVESRGSGGCGQDMFYVFMFLCFYVIYVRGLGRIFASCSSGYKVDTYRTVNGQTVEYRHQKIKSEIGLHHGIFLCRHLGEKLNTTLLPK